MKLLLLNCECVGIVVVVGIVAIIALIVAVGGGFVPRLEPSVQVANGLLQRVNGGRIISEGDVGLREAEESLGVGSWNWQWK